MSVRARIALSLILTAGCASPPVTIAIDAAGPASAKATIRPIGGQTTEGPHSCETPCPVEFQLDETYEIELHAPGYYRARVAVEYWVMYHYKRNSDDEEPRFVIPMLPASTTE